MSNSDPSSLPPAAMASRAQTGLEDAGPLPLDVQALVYLARSSGGVFDRCTQLALSATSATTSLVSLYRQATRTLDVVSGAGHLSEKMIGRQAQPGEALAWRVFSAQTSLLIGDPHHQPDAHFASGNPRPGVYLGVPLVDPDGQIFGVLSVDTTQSGASFSEADVQMLTLLASAAGIAYSRLSVLEQAQALTERYALLAELTSQLESLTGADEIRRTAQQAILPLSGFDTVAFYSVSHLGTGVAVPTFVERTGQFVPEVVEALQAYLNLPESYDMLTEVMGIRSPSLVADYAQSPTRDERMLKAGLGSLVLLPVWHGGVSHGFWLLYTVFRRVMVDEPTLRLLGSLASRVARAIERGENIGQLLATREAALRGLGRVLEYRDSETAGHTDRVTQLAQVLGQRLGLSPDDMLHLRWGAYLHDVGKVAVSDGILRKPGPLTVQERQEMQTHTITGDELLRGEDFLPQQVREVVRHHHERWDGTGYPDGLAGEAIPLLARVFSVVDVYDALTSVRPYKAAWSHEAAVAELRRGAGTQFDPDVVEVFVCQVLPT